MAFWNRSKSDEYLAEARKAKRRKEFDRAGDNFYLAGSVDEALEMYELGGHHNLAAKVLEKLGKTRQAAEQYLLAKDPRMAASLFHKLGDKRRASQLYERLGENYKAAQLEEELGGFQKAAELYVKAGQRERAAKSFARDKNFVRAAEVLEQHLATGGLSPNQDTAEQQWRSLAELQRRAGLNSKAAATFERLGEHARAAETLSGGGHGAQAISMFVRAGEFDKAWELFQKAPDGAVAPGVEAELRAARGEWSLAAGLFRDDRNHSQAADAFEKAGDKVAAAEQYELAGEIEFAAELFFAAGQHSRASRLYESALRTQAAANAARAAGEQTRAAELYELAGEPLDAAKSWIAAGEADKAINLLQKVGAAHEHYTEASILLADAFRAKGLHSIAQEKFESAMQGGLVDQANIGAYYGLAVLKQELGQYDEARTLLERVLAVDFAYRDAATRAQQLRDATPPPRAPAVGGAGPLGASNDTTGGFTAPHPISAGTDPGAGGMSARYEVIGRMGASSRGDVYKAWDTSLGRTVVLKRLAPRDPSDEGQARRYVSEAQNASKLNHSHIATIYDAVDAADGRFVAMEYVFGTSLREILSAEGHVSPGRAIEIVAQVLQALEYAHGAGVIHRNLRPENILIAEKNNVKLTDFGMNRRYADVAAEPYTAASAIHYMSPEQIRGDKLDSRSDIYALGCVLYELLLGRPPFTGEGCGNRQLEAEPIPPSQIDRGIPATIDAVVLRCLRKLPGERFASAHEMIDALRAFDFVPGQRIGDRYELVREIGSGGMGKVYLARDLQLEETIAMKVLRNQAGGDGSLEQRFIREIKLARRVVHPAVVKVFDFGKIQETKFITMEYIEGISLDEYVNRCTKPDWREVSQFAMQILEGLGAAHKLGVVHRDIKPQNILISTNSQGEPIVKIVDFGIARLDEHEDLTNSRHIIGSPKYMSPEQITGKNVDHRTDIYAAGGVLYYCYTGVEPFTAPDTNGIIMKQLRELPVPPCQVNPDLPPWVEMVVLKCLVKDPAGRYQSTDEVVRDIRANLAT